MAQFNGTRVENILMAGEFGPGVIDGLTGACGSRRVTSARRLQARARARVGYAHAPAAILTSGAAQSKLGKNKLPTLGLMLTPERGIMRSDVADIREAFNLTGAFNLCPLASAGCSKGCLVYSGQSGMPVAQRAQVARTAFILAYPYDAGLIVGAELRAAIRRHGEINLRLNVTSDIRWEYISPEMMSAMAGAGIRLYDYTAYSPAQRSASDIYHLTYSAKETSHTSDDYLLAILAGGDNVAMPFATRRGEALPATWHGHPVIDGDISDERRLDPSGVIVGLRAKGYLWKRDNTAGFIRPAVALPVPVVPSSGNA